MSESVEAEVVKIENHKVYFKKTEASRGIMDRLGARQWDFYIPFQGNPGFNRAEVVTVTVEAGKRG